MDDRRRQEIEKRWREIDREIAAIHDGKLIRGTDPATREGELLEEQDALEFELGQEYIDT